MTVPRNRRIPVSEWFRDFKVLPKFPVSCSKSVGECVLLPRGFTAPPTRLRTLVPCPQGMLDEKEVKKNHDGGQSDEVEREREKVSFKSAPSRVRRQGR